MKQEHLNTNENIFTSTLNASLNLKDYFVTSIPNKSEMKNNFFSNNVLFSKPPIYKKQEINAYDLDSPEAKPTGKNIIIYN